MYVCKHLSTIYRVRGERERGRRRPAHSYKYRYYNVYYKVHVVLPIVTSAHLVFHGPDTRSKPLTSMKDGSGLLAETTTSSHRKVTWFTRSLYKKRNVVYTIILCDESRKYIMCWKCSVGAQTVSSKSDCHSN